MGKQNNAYRNRIMRYSEEPPDQLLANPRNWRTHPGSQAEALRGVLADVGYVQAVIVNERTGHLVDGHLRVQEALKAGQATIPVVWVDLSEADEAEVLATLDPLAAMAGTDSAKLDDLLRDVSTDSAAVQAMLDTLATDAGVVPSLDLEDAFGAIPDGDREPFQQMTFTVSDQQAERVKEALALAKGREDFRGTGNENSNGNALWAIAKAYLGER